MIQDEDLITDVLLRTGYLGAISSVAGWVWFGWDVGAGIAVGAALAILNTMALRFVLDRLIPKADNLEAEDPATTEADADAEEDNSSSAVWATGLFLKMTLVLGTAYLAMALLGVHPLGLAFGYSLLLPGLIWAWWRYLERRDAEEDSASAHKREDSSN